METTNIRANAKMSELDLPTVATCNKTNDFLKETVDNVIKGVIAWRGRLCSCHNFIN